MFQKIASRTVAMAPAARRCMALDAKIAAKRTNPSLGYHNHAAVGK
jgi:hypothetical protein